MTLCPNNGDFLHSPMWRSWHTLLLYTLVAAVPLTSSASKSDKSFQPHSLQRMSNAQLLRAREQYEELELQHLRNPEANQRLPREAHRRSLLKLNFWDTTPNYGWDFGDGFDPYKESEYTYAPSYADYDRWSQAYRMLGAYIDCDHNKDDEDPEDDPEDEEGGEQVQGCSRWMMWAAYVNEDYNGYPGRRKLEDGDEPDDEEDDDAEENNDNNSGGLDCGEDGSDWKLLGVYRQEFYQFLEQISKHIWEINDARYITALAGLDYITDEDCQYVGQDNKGNKLYAGIQPLYGGYFQMALYSDTYCLTLSNSGYTYDDFFGGSDLDINCGSDDWGSCSGDKKYYDDDANAANDDVNAANGNDDANGVGNRRRLEGVAAGDDAAQAAGDDGAAAAGDDGQAANAGDDGAAAAGDDGQAANAGDDGQAANAGDDGKAANAGDDGQGMNAGDDGKAEDAEDDEQAMDNGDDKAGADAEDDGEAYYSQGSYGSLDFTVGSKNQAKSVWKAAQEYTLYNVNRIYQEYTKCTNCMDYPTFQDGYFNGNSGYEDDDLINQCWKFYSHDSFTCNGDCQTMALTQGTVLSPTNSSSYSYSGSNKSSQSKTYTYRSQRTYVSADDRDNFLGTTFLLSSAILFAASLSSYCCMGGASETLCEDMMEKPCGEGCADDPYESEYVGEYDEGKTTPWYKRAAVPSRYLAASAHQRGRSTTSKSHHLEPIISSEDESGSARNQLLTSEDESFSPRNQPLRSDDDHSTDNSYGDAGQYEPPKYVYSM